MTRLQTYSTLVIVFFILTALSIFIIKQHWKDHHKQMHPSQATSSVYPLKDDMIEVPQYQVKQFDIAGKIKGLSKKQIDEHLQLYDGYVKKRNAITRDLLTVDRSNAANRTYSPFRSLKTAQTYAINGSLLHELYFGNLSIDQTSQADIGPQMHALIASNFPSLDAFKQDFLDCGGCSRGWVVTAYGIDDGRLHNYVLEEHNQNVPILAIPLLVLDVYEHAYMIDYGINRKPYLHVFWDHINWPVIEERITKWVKPLRTSDA